MKPFLYPSRKRSPKQFRIFSHRPIVMKLMFFLYSFAAVSALFASSVFGQSYAITNARIVTVSGGTIEKGTVVVRNGLIEAVGAEVKVPADAKTIDGSGLTVYPGFIDTRTNLGIPAPPRPTGGGPGGGPGGGQAAAAAAAAAQVGQSNSNYPAGLRPEDLAVDDIRAGDASFEANRNAGFTTAVVVGRTGIFNGESAIINLAGENVSAMVIKSPAALNISFATIPGRYPGSLLGTFSALRQMFYDARRLQEVKKQYSENPKGIKRPESDRSLEALFPALNGEMPVVFNANREMEIVRALNVAKEFNLKAIIAGGQEAWKLADRLKAENVPVLLSLNFPKRTAAASPEADPESLDTLRFRAETPKTAARLAQAGVRFAFQSGGMTSIADFAANAKKSIDAGLSRDAAVRAMTLAGAEIFGIADRTGSVEAGKIANLTVVKGELFADNASVSHVFIDGQHFQIKEQPRREGRPGPGQGPGRRPPSISADIGGTYGITIDIPGQPMSGTLTLEHRDGTISGNMQTQLGTTPIKNGKATDDGFEFVATVEFGGESMEITVRGKISGNQITGTIDSPQGSVGFSGSRTP